jgi:hypothetical protein
MATLQQGVIVVAWPGLFFSLQILRAEKRAENVDLTHKKRAAFDKRRQASRRWCDQVGRMKDRSIKNIPVPVNFDGKGTV